MQYVAESANMIPVLDLIAIYLSTQLLLSVDPVAEARSLPVPLSHAYPSSDTDVSLCSESVKSGLFASYGHAS